MYMQMTISVLIANHLPVHKQTCHSIFWGNQGVLTASLASCGSSIVVTAISFGIGFSPRAQVAG
jgi:hypothetical protein